jgi:hypothetical protein
VLVSTHDGAIYELDCPSYLPIIMSIFLKLSQYLVPDAGFTPAIEARGYTLPGAIAFRQVSPESTGLIYPQDAIDDGAVVFTWSPCVGLLRREQWL